MGKVFISYRREDSDATVGRIYDRLRDHFGKENVFRDKGSISPGHNFPDRIEEALADADAMLVIIGPRWLTALHDDGRRRLDVATDWVRREVATALKRGILVVPTLVLSPVRIRRDTAVYNGGAIGARVAQDEARER